MSYVRTVTIEYLVGKQLKKCLWEGCRAISRRAMLPLSIQQFNTLEHEEMVHDVYRAEADLVFA